MVCCDRKMTPAGPKSTGVFAAINTSDHADLGIKQRCYNLAQIVWLHLNITVAGHQNVVSGNFGHAMKRPCRRIRPGWFPIYDNAAANLRIARAYLAHNIECRIVSGVSGKNNFVVTVLLDKKTFHILFEPRIQSMYRLQQGNRRKIRILRERCLRAPGITMKLYCAEYGEKQKYRGRREPNQSHSQNKVKGVQAGVTLYRQKQVRAAELR